MKIFKLSFKVVVKNITVLNIIVGMCLIQAPLGAWARKKEIPVTSGRSFRQQIETQAEFFEKELTLAKNNKERFKSLKKIEAKFHEIRRNNEEVGTEDAAFLETVVGGFKLLPRDGKRFKQKDCLSYQHEFLNKYIAAADGAPQDPAAKYAWNSLLSFCK